MTRLNIDWAAVWATISSWKWGDLATWVTGVLTAGSLWLGFSIVRSDRQKNATAQIARLVVRQKLTRLKHVGDDLEMFLTNTSDQPFYNVSIVMYTSPNQPRRGMLGYKRKRYLMDMRKAVIKGGHDDYAVFRGDTPVY